MPSADDPSLRLGVIISGRCKTCLTTSYWAEIADGDVHTVRLAVGLGDGGTQALGGPRVAVGVEGDVGVGRLRAVDIQRDTAMTAKPVITTVTPTRNPMRQGLCLRRTAR